MRPLALLPGGMIVYIIQQNSPVAHCVAGLRRVTMAVPRKKTSPMKRGQRRSADALKAPTYIEDKDSGERRRPHHVDLKTGKYRGRQILEPKADV